MTHLDHLFSGFGVGATGDVGIDLLAGNRLDQLQVLGGDGI